MKRLQFPRSASRFTRRRDQSLRDTLRLATQRGREAGRGGGT
jgi:hypothetical protein